MWKCRHGERDSSHGAARRTVRPLRPARPSPTCSGPAVPRLVRLCRPPHPGAAARLSSACGGKVHSPNNVGLSARGDPRGGRKASRQHTRQSKARLSASPPSPSRCPPRRRAPQRPAARAAGPASPAQVRGCTRPTMLTLPAGCGAPRPWPIVCVLVLSAEPGRVRGEGPRPRGKGRLRSPLSATSLAAPSARPRRGEGCGEPPRPGAQDTLRRAHWALPPKRGTRWKTLRPTCTHKEPQNRHRGQVLAWTGPPNVPRHAGVKAAGRQRTARRPPARARADCPMAKFLLLGVVADQLVGSHRMCGRPLCSRAPGPTFHPDCDHFVGQAGPSRRGKMHGPRRREMPQRIDTVGRGVPQRRAPV